nr:ankyrin repeat domain-containing protein 7-like [Cherax quadricarinatus]
MERTPLAWLTVRRLLLEGLLVLMITMTSTTASGDTAGDMIAAIVSGNAQELERLLNTHGSANLASTPLLAAIRTNNTEFVELLLSRGTDVDFGASGEIPLLEAMKLGNKNLVDLIMARRPSLNRQDGTGTTPLLEAIRSNDTEFVRELVDAGALVMYSNNRGEQPLIEAIKLGNRELTKVLIERTSDINVKDSSGSTPLLAAIDTSNVGIVTDVVNASPNIEIVGNAGVTPLVAAIRKNNLTIVEIILEAGADVNLILSGVVPLIEAVKLGGEAMVDAVLEKCPQLSNTDYNGLTAAQVARTLGFTQIAADIEDKRAQCTRCPDQCVKCPRGVHYTTDQNDWPVQDYLDDGVLGNTSQLECLVSGYISWTCTETGRWEVR